jgi:hypothetical protein
MPLRQKWEFGKCVLILCCKIAFPLSSQAGVSLLLVLPQDRKLCDMGLC